MNVLNKITVNNHRYDIILSGIRTAISLYKSLFTARVDQVTLSDNMIKDTSSRYALKKEITDTCQGLSLPPMLYSLYDTCLIEIVSPNFNQRHNFTYEVRQLLKNKNIKTIYNHADLERYQDHNVYKSASNVEDVAVKQQYGLRLFLNHINTGVFDFFVFYNRYEIQQSNDYQDATKNNDAYIRAFIYSDLFHSTITTSQFLRNDQRTSIYTFRGLECNAQSAHRTYSVRSLESYLYNCIFTHSIFVNDPNEC